MGKKTDAVRDKLATVRKATDEARVAFLAAEDRLNELEDREARRAERRQAVRR